MKCWATTLSSRFMLWLVIAGMGWRWVKWLIAITTGRKMHNRLNRTNVLHYVSFVIHSHVRVFFKSFISHRIDIWILQSTKYCGFGLNWFNMIIIIMHYYFYRFVVHMVFVKYFPFFHCLGFFMRIYRDVLGLGTTHNSHDPNLPTENPMEHCGQMAISCKQFRFVFLLLLFTKVFSVRSSISCLWTLDFELFHYFHYPKIPWHITYCIS